MDRHNLVFLKLNLEGVIKMKIQVMFKMPDWDEQLKDQLPVPSKDEIQEMGTTMEDEMEFRVASLKKIISKKWLEYGECITIEFDTEKDTATVVER